MVEKKTEKDIDELVEKIINLSEDELSYFTFKLEIAYGIRNLYKNKQEVKIE